MIKSARSRKIERLVIGVLSDRKPKVGGNAALLFVKRYGDDATR
jgi:hypothetical protein